MTQQEHGSFSSALLLRSGNLEALRFACAQLSVLFVSMSNARMWLADMQLCAAHLAQAPIVKSIHDMAAAEVRIALQNAMSVSHLETFLQHDNIAVMARQSGLCVFLCKLPSSAQFASICTSDDGICTARTRLARDADVCKVHLQVPHMSFSEGVVFVSDPAASPQSLQRLVAMCRERPMQAVSWDMEELNLAEVVRTDLSNVSCEHDDGHCDCTGRSYEAECDVSAFASHLSTLVAALCLWSDEPVFDVS